MLWMIRLVALIGEEIRRGRLWLSMGVSGPCAASGQTPAKNSTEHIPRWKTSVGLQAPKALRKRSRNRRLMLQATYRLLNSFFHPKRSVGSRASSWPIGHERPIGHRLHKATPILGPIRHCLHKADPLFRPIATKTRKVIGYCFPLDIPKGIPT